MSLVEYRRKRRFDSTPEPAPGSRLPRGRRPIFVVQLHHASHRHYDFRLQVGNTLKSWAVPKGPSLDPAVKRLAAEVEDHPVDYADFEGEIPKGEYGGGHVATFDKGIWTTEGSPEEQLAKGHLRFEMFGDKLKGGWHLVRTQKPARTPQWLLFKERDRYAGKQEADDLLEDVVGVPAKHARPKAAKAAKASPSSRRSPKRSDPWGARAAKLQHARATNHLPSFRSPQLAKLTDTVPAGDEWLHEAKWDGYRLIAQINRGKVRLWSRNEREWTKKVPEIVGALEVLGLQDGVLDGELVAGAGRQEDFGLLQAVLSGERNAVLSYLLFDVLQIDGVDLSRSPQYQRKALLAEILKKPPAHLIYSSHIVGRGEQALAMAIERGLEGIISKRADASYHGGRGDAWRKIKQRNAEEFAIVGFTPPKGSRTGLGALLLATPDPDHGWRYVGRVGTGFNAQLLADLPSKLARDARAKPRVHVAVDDPELRHARWVRPRHVAEVFFHGWGSQGLLRQSSLKTIRADKTADELQENGMRHPTATSAPAPSAKKKERAPPAVTLSNPDRVVFAEAGITKAQVFDYYQAMLPWLLPEVAGRPLSVVRCPQGADRPSFFQKHHTAGMEHVGAVSLEEDSGNRADYLVVDEGAGVLELVQFNALEFHPWGATATSPDKADYMVFDLDPGPDVAWRQVAEAARQVRGRLEAMDLDSFVRTSGGKGLHVVVPLNPACPWTRVKPFAHAFAESMAAAEPLAYVATASKKFRKGRIFIDYLRNGRGATSVASFSLRARPGAPVAMPLRWSELGRVKAGDAFDLVSARRRMERMKTHPWDAWTKVRQDLDGAMRAIEKKTARAGTKRMPG